MSRFGTAIKWTFLCPSITFNPHLYIATYIADICTYACVYMRSRNSSTMRTKLLLIHRQTGVCMCARLKYVFWKMYLEDEIEKPALSAAVITYEDCDSRRVHLADTLTYTHTHTLAHTKYVYKCRVVAEKKRQAGRQTGWWRQFASNPQRGTEKTAAKKTKLRKKPEKTKTKQVSASSSKQDTTINTPPNYSIYQICWL